MSNSDNAYKHLDSWKNSKFAFEQQLTRNKIELENGFPPHWVDFIQVLQKLLKPLRVVDVGCGAGAYAHICDNLGYNYIGYDYSQIAVDLATENWGDYFVCKPYEEIQKEDIQSMDLVVANAICDVLPNGDECLRHLLSLGAEYLLVQRARLTNKENYFTEYQAYNIMTYEFYHNENQLDKDIESAGYTCEKVRLYDDVFDLHIRKKDETQKISNSNTAIIR